MLSSILSFVQNPLYTASNYTKMSLKNSQAVKNLDFVDALLSILDHRALYNIISQKYFKQLEFTFQLQLRCHERWTHFPTGRNEETLKIKMTREMYGPTYLCLNGIEVASNIL